MVLVVGNGVDDLGSTLGLTWLCFTNTVGKVWVPAVLPKVVNKQFVKLVSRLGERKHWTHTSYTPFNNRNYIKSSFFITSFSIVQISDPTRMYVACNNLLRKNSNSFLFLLSYFLFHFSKILYIVPVEILQVMWISNLNHKWRESIKEVWVISTI